MNEPVILRITPLEAKLLDSALQVYLQVVKRQRDLSSLESLAKTDQRMSRATALRERIQGQFK